MSELKVGDKFIDIKNKRQIVEVLALTNRRIIYGEATGWQDGNCIESFLKHSTPYQEPAPVKRIVCHGWYLGGDVYWSIEGSDECRQRDNSSLCERIELSPEMFMGAK